MKQIISITDITEFLYCPRKVYLKLVKGIRSPPNERMINGMLRHKVFDLFNKDEPALVSGIKEKIEAAEIKKIYNSLLNNVSNEVISFNSAIMGKFGINPERFIKSVKESANPEIALRVPSITSALNQGFLGKELWRNLKPKYQTELKLESPELGLKGRVDRVLFGEKIMPVEIKTQDKIYESDKIQLAGYALLLEKEFNKSIEKGIVEFMGNQQEIELTPELKSRVLEIAEKIRNLTEENAEFPSNFEKCRNCGLKENCG